jgi:hypothetical protein
MQTVASPDRLACWRLIWLCVWLLAPLLAQGEQGSTPPIQAPAESEFHLRLSTAARLYEELEYERALEQLGRAKSVARTVDEDVAVLLYEGIILSDMGRREEARAAFKAALYLRATARLPVVVSPKVEADLEVVRQEVERSRQQQARPTPGIELGSKAELAPQVELAPQAQSALKGKPAPEAEPVSWAEPSWPKPAALADAPILPQEQPIMGPAALRSSTEVLQPQLARKDAPAVPRLTLALVGAGAVAGGAGGFFGLRSFSQEQDARNAEFLDERLRHLEDARTNGRVANMFFAFAGAAAAGALITYLAQPDDSPVTKASP